MNWGRAKLIFFRELRDQLRDRRALFMILVLPIVLYPVLGVGLLQLTLSFGKQQRTIGVAGWQDLPANPPLLSDNRESFHPDLFENAKESKLIIVDADDELTRSDVIAGKVDALVEIPPGTADRLARGEQVTLRVLYDSGDDRSDVAQMLLRDVLSEWSSKIVAQRLEKAGKPANFTRPITIDDGLEDVAVGTGRSGSIWGRMFPFLLVLMALTGAFYTAIDLCAGEKERGTMETLLISPASRGEIVLGKFMTIFLFSVMTTTVNLTSMGLTFAQISNMLPGGPTGAAADTFAPPSFTSIVWMFVLMLPMSAFFSALCMALAIFARSTKEGQYYLMPLFMLVMPLVMPTLAPGIELDAFYSLVPVTNVALLIKALMLNEYQTAAVYFVPVLAPTILYGYLALRYARDQFDREDVLFREAERFDIREWVVNLLRDKRPVITFRQAWAFFVAYLVIRWYLQGSFGISLRGVVLSQIVTLLVPALLMTFLFTRSPSRSLNLRLPLLIPTIASLMLAFTLHPVALAFGQALRDVLKLDNADAFAEAMTPLLANPLWKKLLVMALVPAVCEEIAFRGLMLTGFLQRYRPPLAILVTSILFGISHMIPEQMIATTLLGIIFGIIATRTGSIFPSIVVHALHNGMAVTYHHQHINAPETAGYNHAWVVMGALASAILVGYLVSQPSRLRRTPQPLSKGWDAPSEQPSGATSAAV